MASAPFSHPTLLAATAATRRRKHIAFGASAGCFPYQLGIAAFISKNFDLTDVTFSGSSGGAWPAILLASDVDIEFSFEILTCLGSEQISSSMFGRHWDAYGQFGKATSVVFDKIFQGIDLRRRVKGRLSISLTRLALYPLPHLKNEIISTFLSNQDVFDCMLASCLIPFAVNGQPFVQYRGWICVDSVLTNVTGALRGALHTERQVKCSGAERGGGVEEGYEECKDSTSDDDLGSKLLTGSSAEDLPTSFTGLSLPLACSSGCRIFVADFLEVLRGLLYAPPAKAPADGPNPNSNPHPNPHHLMAAGAGIEESRPFGLLSLSLRTSRSVASQIFNAYLTPSSSSNRIAVPAPAPLSSCSRGGDEAAEDGLLTLTLTAEDGLDGQQVLIASEGADDADGGYDNWMDSDREQSPVRAAGNPNPNPNPKSDREQSPLTLPLTEPEELRPEPTPTLKSSSAPALRVIGMDATELEVQGSTADTADKGYWHDAVKGSSIKSLPGSSSLVLEITPWMWRSMPLRHYHLTRESDQMWALFELGCTDAAFHVSELSTFFDSS